MFNGQVVHPFYSTFALGRDAEWCCRQFVLQAKEENEEGIGTFLTINHHSPALLNEQVTITATITHINHNTIDCSYTVNIENRVVATGTQGQKILPKTKIESIKADLQ